MSDSDTSVCLGIPINTDISGLGVRVALYLQSILSVLLVRFSPPDAPAAYWSMTSTAISLVISAFVTRQQISLLDAIVVVYVLLLPVLASAFGLSEIMASSSAKKATRSVHSPLLILANWTRSAFTYAFAIYVWVTAPTFGSGPPECNVATRLIFFGASLPALGSGRILNLTIWGLFTLLFLYRAIGGSKTIYVAFLALFSANASQALLKPKQPPRNEVRRETTTKVNFATGERTDAIRWFRPRPNFHELLRSLISQVLDLGSGHWYQAYGKTILVSFLAAWAIIMTELELLRNNLKQDPNKQLGFGQILPLVLTISPLFSLYESVLARRSSGPADESRKLRISIRKAKGLQRPHCELDGYPEHVLENIPEAKIKAIRAPSPFAVITIDEREMYTTFEKEDDTDPDWDESFDVEIGDLSTIVIRVFDRKCIDQNWPALIGFTTILPFSLLPPPKEQDIINTSSHSSLNSSVDIDNIPLVREGVTISDMSVSISLSNDTRVQPTLPIIPPRLYGPEQTHVERRVALVKFGNKTMGRKKVKTTRVYQLDA